LRTSACYDSSVKRRLHFDARIDAYVIDGDDELETEEEVEAWKRHLFSQLEAVGAKVYLLIDIGGLRISPAVSSLYGEIAKEVTERFTLGVVRYTSIPSRLTTATVQIEAAANLFSSNIRPDRESAEKALAEMRHS